MCPSNSHNTIYINSTQKKTMLYLWNQLIRYISMSVADSMFLATISTSFVSVSPGEPIIWDSAPINPGGHFNTILGMYEVPVDGYYT